MPRPSKGVKPLEIDLNKLNEGKNSPKPLHKHPDITPIHAPYETPAYVRAHRLMSDVEGEPSGFVGTTLEVDAFTFGVKVFIRFGMDRTLKIFAEDGDGTIKLEEWSL